MIAGARKNYREQFQKMIYKKSLNIINTRAEKSERRKGGKRQEKAEKADLVMQLAFWQTCQNAMK